MVNTVIRFIFHPLITTKCFQIYMKNVKVGSGSIK